MATPTNTTTALSDAVKIEKVWGKNASMTLGSETDPKNPKVTHADFLKAKKDVEDADAEIDELRLQIDGLLNERNDGAKVLSDLNTRALSAIRGIFGPDSTEYEQAGGTRSSERKKPVRKATGSSK
jgi:hypothetical protein